MYWVQIRGHALQAPARQVAENSTIDGGMVVPTMPEGRGNIGFDAVGKSVCQSCRGKDRRSDLRVRIALGNAVGVRVLLLAGAMMIDLLEPKPGICRRVKLWCYPLLATLYLGFAAARPGRCRNLQMHDQLQLIGGVSRRIN